ncbi:hypothetical protein NP590_07680 [Methylomonas sp. SURF-2]|uniref:Oxidoreductase n=1 Tax=Methylomonas subterranea TaxID=2952225 RepID=A0ABT1TEX4_9GAMM|nr:hypothetical protein [Methylomonas sp. SURF-2]MCQ8103980.1 hypothetical protein [Methylomonas sp. SURF-2]
MSDDTFQGLKALPFKFPRTCGSCGRVYRTEAEFLEQTQALGNDRSPIKAAEDDDGRVILEVFRNCVCGSTLMDEFHSRRDNSPEGQRRREAYAQALAAGRNPETHGP